MKKATCYLNRMQSDPPLEESLFAHRTLLDGDEDTRSLTFAYHFGLNRQFRVRRNRIFDLRERRPVLCSLTTNTYRKGKRIIRWSQPERVAER